MILSGAFQPVHRVLKTEHIVMDELDQLWVPEVKDWRLNERHYGDCIGQTRRDVHGAHLKPTEPNDPQFSLCHRIVFLSIPGCTASEFASTRHIISSQTGPPEELQRIVRSCTCNRGR